MGFPPPPNFPAVPAIPELPAEFCPVLPIPALSLKLGFKGLEGPGLGITGGVDADASLDFPLGIRAIPCGFCLALPKLKLSFNFNLGFIFPPSIPLPFISLKLSCDLANPISVSAGLDFGGGRTARIPLDPDLQESP